VVGDTDDDDDFALVSTGLIGEGGDDVDVEAGP
jgi:hypothetical protein